ncbi:hypothetical protein [Cupriavidus necator]|uniref:hypothetical protein n=1 Tax=Cupriavidus necator TaxID=106590 RepID=UPI00339D54F4
MSSLLLLDLDGTLIDTPHYEAWRSAGEAMGAPGLTREEYLTVISGRPRLEGAARLLALKGSAVPDDPCDPARIARLAEIKQKEFLRLSSRAGFFDDALRLLQRTLAAQQCVRFYTASQNARGLFEAALHQAGLRLNQLAAVVQQQSGQSREAMFQHLADGHDPAAVMLVDDSPYAVDMACHLGMRACQIRRDESQARATDSRACVLSSLDELVLPIRTTAEEWT